MTAAQTAYYKATGSESSSTPAEVGKRVVEGVLGREVPDDRMNALNQGMHWAYGTSWGLPFGIAVGSSRSSDSVVSSGIALATLAWAAGRGELTAMKLAPPPWQDPPSSLAVDVGSHLVYGLATAAAFRAVR
ncbi:MAG: hypothetical protein ACR2IN_08380 [Thermoleophilaceae bacterium]|jgi:hypothetical protein|nr:hypothetical protein [Thermoleophilaceae bacterium]